MGPDALSREALGPTQRMGVEQIKPHSDGRVHLTCIWVKGRPRLSLPLDHSKVLRAKGLFSHWKIYRVTIPRPLDRLYTGIFSKLGM